MGVLTVIRNRLAALRGENYLVTAPEIGFSYLPDTPSGFGADVYFLITPKGEGLFLPAQLNSFLRDVVNEDVVSTLVEAGALETDFDNYTLTDRVLHIGGFDVIAPLGELRTVFSTNEQEYKGVVVLARNTMEELGGSVVVGEVKSPRISVGIKAYPTKEIMYIDAGYVRSDGRRRKVGRDSIRN